MEVTVVLGSVPTKIIEVARGMPGVDGRDIELRQYDNEIQWRYVGEAWQTLITSADLAISGSVDWTAVTNKPTTFAPSAHTHPQSDIDGLVDALTIFDGGTF